MLMLHQSMVMNGAEAQSYTFFANTQQLNIVPVSGWKVVVFPIRLPVGCPDLNVL